MFSVHRPHCFHHAIYVRVLAKRVTRHCSLFLDVNFLWGKFYFSSFCLLFLFLFFNSISKTVLFFYFSTMMKKGIYFLFPLQGKQKKSTVFTLSRIIRSKKIIQSNLEKLQTIAEENFFFSYRKYFNYLSK